jgi:plastocyanin
MRGRRIMLACLAATTALAAALPASGALSAPAQRATVKKVNVVDDYYAPTKLTIKKGQSVKWVWNAYNTDSHNVALNKGPSGVNRGKFKSPTGTIGLHFQKQFTKPGTYKFLCTLHRTVMKMTVVVNKP